jgi:hypothetical protein
MMEAHIKSVPHSLLVFLKGSPSARTTRIDKPTENKHQNRSGNVAQDILKMSTASTNPNKNGGKSGSGGGNPPSYHIRADEYLKLILQDRTTITTSPTIAQPTRRPLATGKSLQNPLTARHNFPVGSL